LLPSASGMVEFPPLITVPGAAVVNVGTWQVSQPILANSVSPPSLRRCSLLRVARRSLGGAYERAKRSMSVRHLRPLYRLVRRPCCTGLSLHPERDDS